MRRRLRSHNRLASDSLCVLTLKFTAPGESARDKLPIPAILIRGIDTPDTNIIKAWPEGIQDRKLNRYLNCDGFEFGPAT